MPQATRSCDHRTYRCYLRGPDGFVSFRPADLGQAGSYRGLGDRSTRPSGPTTSGSAPPHMAGSPMARALSVSHGSVMSNESTYPPHALGAWGERLAAERLLRRGWRIVEKNYRLGRREVDLIVRRGEILAFVEVKTRAGARFGPPEASVTRRKQREIETVARDFIMRRRPDCPAVRFDVVAIVVGPGRRLLRYEHIEDAWRPRS